MKLELQGNDLRTLIRLAVEGIWAREKVIWRLWQSNLPKELSKAVKAADRALVEVEKALRDSDKSNDRYNEAIEATLQELNRSLGVLSDLGWDDIAFMVEAGRYELVLESVEGRWLVRFYNPSTGQHDLKFDAGWQSRGLPKPKRRLAI